MRNNRPLSFLLHIAARARFEVDRRRPDVPVTRRIHGVDIVMPRHHLLPYLTSGDSVYNLNLVELARGLYDLESTLTLLDVGGNVGDSALGVLSAVPAYVVCVEADPAWQKYLDMNVAGRDDVAVEPYALVPPGYRGGFEINHADVGSSNLVPAAEGSGPPSISTDELLERNPRLQQVRLIKTDTDGYDVLLVPAMAETFKASRPVIFFEFEALATSLATPELPLVSVWERLLDQGYEDAVLWDNGGRLLGPDKVANLIARSGQLSEAMSSAYFWDVAVAHKDDATGLEVLRSVACDPAGHAEVGYGGA
ncbi:hypothetical protein Back2_07780 [Nocardioides baekrokdamisoli]|uniref:Methyltransferase FkbM domain-containing protein n=1 Tax=Nocardioides baekrokdamisoli TaxID=1804624 RepID=A0A3G9IS95_9ACTN|nr:FkbM family methyltransferase [Nocardioides baekrokdamisoli]BBH16491.1 hypothetical protein Back2_07780 [Nocardioides baekrokdamisoli]